MLGRVAVWKLSGSLYINGVGLGFVTEKSTFYFVYSHVEYDYDDCFYGRSSIETQLFCVSSQNYEKRFGKVCTIICVFAYPHSWRCCRQRHHNVLIKADLVVIGHGGKCASATGSFPSQWRHARRARHRQRTIALDLSYFPKILRRSDRRQSIMPGTYPLEVMLTLRTAQ